MSEAGEAPGPPTRDVPAEDLRGVLDAERAATEHWRQVARHDRAALDALKHRTAVRAALALERRAQPLHNRLARVRGRLGQQLAQGRLALRALPARRGLSHRRARLVRALEELPPKPHQRHRVSIVMVAEQSIGFEAREHGDPTTEVIAVRTESSLAAPEVADRVISGMGLGPVAAARLGASAARREVLCFLAPTTEPLEDGWLDRLTAQLGGAVAAATPMLIHPERPVRHATPHDLRVRMLGVDLDLGDESIPVSRSREAGSEPAPRRPTVEVTAGSSACLVVDRGAYEDVGGLAPLPDLESAAFDLCQRLRQAGRSVVAVPSSTAIDHRPASSVRELTSPIRSEGPGWRAVVERHGPALVRSALGAEHEPLSFALTVAAPSAKVANRWGDWHLARALQRSLRGLGHRVLVQTADRADDLAGRSTDVHVVLRGLAPVRRTPGQRHVLWVISHPEQIDTDECDEADLVLVASDRFAVELRNRTSTPVEVLLQATDHRRFRPVPRDPTHAHPIVVVAKTRDVLRPAVADALTAGLRPAIYGSGWEGFVDPELVVADYVPNVDLPVVYSSAGVLLNDHWGTMRSWGFASNRLFDALACATPVISDDLPEIHEIFGDAVPTYRDPNELAALVHADLDDPVAARERASAGRQEVLAVHTFDHRARELLDSLTRHRLDHPPS